MKRLSHQKKHDNSFSRISKRQSKVLEGIWNQYGSDMYRAAYLVLLHEQDTEDACQQTMLQLAGHTDALSDMSENEQRRYVLIASRNTAVSHLRRRHPELFSDDEAEELPAGNAPPDEAFAEMGSERIRAAMRKLNRRDYLLLQWKYFERLDNEEIAENLSCSPDSVRTLTARARNRLKGYLKEDSWFDEYWKEN